MADDTLTGLTREQAAAILMDALPGVRENAITQLPKLLGGAGPNGVLGLPYLVMSKLPGTTVAAISGAMPDAELADVYRQMGALLARVHAIGQDAYGIPDHGHHRSPAVRRSQYDGDAEPGLAELSGHDRRS
ncbi:phosphotransferase [Catenulispora sp. NF23]|uniref:phosphotransferase family protein n=1 Tax=Catenulispora pinistramenti TaxID=2705254 RepID=UPI001BAE13B7|nr:phosphotransferase [Catenulispora pinistramenti]MBS2534303.1 phosphotransferase [Catenulispora pinistramenti]